jgi:CheY-like chemotaxis protein
MARILLVEDNDITRFALTKFLRNGGHDVMDIKDGSGVMSLIGSFEPEVVVTDIVMPEVDGIEVINMVRDQGWPLPIIAISGGGRIAGRDYLELAAAIGAAATLEKPFDAEALLQAVDTVLAS